MKFAYVQNGNIPSVQITTQLASVYADTCPTFVELARADLFYSWKFICFADVNESLRERITRVLSLFRHCSAIKPDPASTSLAEKCCHYGHYIYRYGKCFVFMFVLLLIGKSRIIFVHVHSKLHQYQYAPLNDSVSILTDTFPI